MDSGSFEWREVSGRFFIPEHAVAVTMILGLEKVNGELWLKDIRLARKPLPAVAPQAKADAGQRGTFALRPEQVRLYGRQETAELHNRFTGQVTDLLYLGDVTVYKVALDQGPVVEALMANAAPGRARFHEVGDPVTVAWRHDAGLFLDR